jgi:hypothetical protein
MNLEFWSLFYYGSILEFKPPVAKQIHCTEFPTLDSHCKWKFQNPTGTSTWPSVPGKRLKKYLTRHQGPELVRCRVSVRPCALPESDINFVCNSGFTNLFPKSPICVVWFFFCNISIFRLSLNWGLMFWASLFGISLTSPSFYLLP